MSRGSKQVGHHGPGCSGKRRYRDKREADRALHRLAASERQEVPCRAYECPHCAGWHLTKREMRGV